jgi:hypothetical protein
LDFINEMKKRLIDAKATRIEVVSSGRCENIESYNRSVGEITGLLIALETIEVILNDNKEDGD